MVVVCVIIVCGIWEGEFILWFYEVDFLFGKGIFVLISRGFIEEDFEKVVEFFDWVVGIVVKVKKFIGEIYINYYFFWNDG